MRLLILIIHDAISIYADGSDTRPKPGPVPEVHSPPAIVFEDPPDCLQHTADMSACLYARQSSTQLRMGSIMKSLDGNQLVVVFQIDSSVPGQLNLDIPEANGTFLFRVDLPSGMKLTINFTIPYFSASGGYIPPPRTNIKELTFGTILAIEAYVPNWGSVKAYTERIGKARAYIPGPKHPGFVKMAHHAERRERGLFAEVIFYFGMYTLDGVNWKRFYAYADVKIRGERDGTGFDHQGRLHLFNKSS